MSLIKCNNIEFKYDNKEILKNISFEINKGDYLCIIGENGSGKSTLLNIISGVLKPNFGTVVHGYTKRKTNCKLQHDFT